MCVSPMFFFCRRSGVGKMHDIICMLSSSAKLVLWTSVPERSAILILLLQRFEITSRIFLGEVTAGWFLRRNATGGSKREPRLKSFEAIYPCPSTGELE